MNSFRHGFSFVFSFDDSPDEAAIHDERTSNGFMVVRNTIYRLVCLPMRGSPYCIVINFDFGNPQPAAVASGSHYTLAAIDAPLIKVDIREEVGAYLQALE